MSPLLRRVTAAFGAGAFGQASNILIQLFSLPIFLKYWDMQTYGVWIMLSAVPGYLSMADVGMVAAAGNRMTMEMARGQVAEANRIFHSAFVFMMTVCGGVALLTVPIVLFAPIDSLPTLDQRLALICLICGVLLAMFGGLSEAAFKASNRYALGTMLGNISRLGEWVGWIIGLLITKSYLGVAIGGLCARLCGTLTLAILSSKDSQGLTWRISGASSDEIKSMIRPAVSFMIFPLANAISFQGITLLVGHQFGAATVVIFNTYRTLARVAVQVTGTFSNALWAEFSRLYGLSGAAGVAPLYKRSSLLGAAGAFMVSLVLFFASPWILAIWTHGRVPFDPTLMLVLLIYAAIGGAWHIPRVLLMSTNQHVGLAQWFLASSVLAFGLAGLAGTHAGLMGAGLAMLVSELVIAGLCIFLAHALLRPPNSMREPLGRS